MADPLKDFLFIDQLKIMGYGESDTSGCWIKFQLTPELLEDVRGRKGEMVEVAARLIDNSGEYVPPDKAPAIEITGDQMTGKLHKWVNKTGEHGKYWQNLIRSGLFNAPPVLEAIGSEDEYKEWIQKRPSCISKESDWVEELGEGRCEYAHVRRISEGSGTGIKPDYFGVPLTHEEHRYQHQQGETAALAASSLRPGPKKQADPTDVQWEEWNAAQWFEKKAAHYRLEWASTTLASQLGFPRRRDCPPELVEAWAKERDLGRFLPKMKA